MLQLGDILVRDIDLDVRDDVPCLHMSAVGDQNFRYRAIRLCFCGNERTFHLGVFEHHNIMRALVEPDAADREGSEHQ